MVYGLIYYDVGQQDWSQDGIIDQVEYIFVPPKTIINGIFL